MPGTDVRETRSTTTCPDSVTSTPHVLEVQPGGVRHGADGHQRVRALDRAPVGELDDDALLGAPHRGGPAALGDPAAAGLEDLLHDLGGVGVLTGQHLVAGGDEGDRDAGLEVAGGELGAGDAGADDDEVLGHLLEVVDVAPVEDPLAVGLGAGQHARVGAGRDEDDVALQLLGDLRRRRPATSTWCAARPRTSSASRPCPETIRTPSPARRAWMSADWAMARPLTRWLTDARSRPTVARSAPCSPRTAESRTDVMAPGGGDEGLGRDAVGEHAGAPDAVALDDGDLGTELRGDQRGLVAGRSAADDDDAGHGSFPGAGGLSSRRSPGHSPRCRPAAL